MIAVVLLIHTTSTATLEARALPRVEQVRIGFDGRFRVGFWTPVWTTVKGGDESLDGRLEVVVPDGDDLQTRYSNSMNLNSTNRLHHFAAGQTTTLLHYVKWGRLDAGLTVRLRGERGVITERAFAPREIATAIPSTRQLIVSFGGDVGIEDALRFQRRRSPELSTASSCQVNSASDLPPDWFGYEGIETLVLATSQLELIRQLSAAQLKAIQTWVKLGGRLILCVGLHGQTLLASGGPLAEFAPGEFQRQGLLEKTVDLETYAKATQRLDRISGTQQLNFTSLKNVQGRVESQEDNVGALGPTVVRSAHGLGQIVFVALDLDRSPVSGWRGRARMVAALLQNESDAPIDTDSFQRTGKMTHEGYDDLVGQLRAALDQFSGVTLVPFTAVGVLTVLYILVIGPGDYFLLRKLLKRMEWTWITFPASVVLFCSLSVYLATVLKSAQVRINQVELIDIDAKTSIVRGTVWSQLYSPRNRAHSLAFQPQLPFAGEARGVLLSWQGLPGTGLGGMDNRSTKDWFRTSYAIVRQSGPADSQGTRVEQMPVQVASSKSLGVRWWGNLTAEVDYQLEVDPRSDLLRGTFTNPLEVELSECALFYGNSAYQLNQKLGPGQTVAVEAMRERSVDLHLRPRSADDRSRRWQHASTDVPRILSTMMFHQAAGARAYTNLWHNYQPYVDLSRHLALDRAILTGWTTQRAGVLSTEDRPLDEDYNRQWTFYRVVLPVDRIAN